RRADRRDEPAAGRGTVGAGRGGPLLRGRRLGRRPGLLPLLLPLFLLLLLLPLLLGLLALLGRLGGGRLRTLPWRRGLVGLPGPAVRQREPLAGQDQGRLGADGRAVGVVQRLPAAAYALAGRDAGEGVAADDGVHLGAARAGLGGLLRLDVLDGGPAALACRPGLLCLLLLAGSGVPGVLTVGPVGGRTDVGRRSAPGQPGPDRAHRPGPGTLAVQHLLGDGDLLVLGGQVRAGRVAGAAVLLPRGLGELQAAVVAVAGVDVPVVGRLAGGDLVPGPHVGRLGDAGRHQRERHSGTARGDGE